MDWFYMIQEECLVPYHCSIFQFWSLALLLHQHLQHIWPDKDSDHKIFQLVFRPEHLLVLQRISFNMD
jgi:hypothetical protein